MQVHNSACVQFVAECYHKPPTVNHQLLYQLLFDPSNIRLWALHSAMHRYWPRGRASAFVLAVLPLMGKSVQTVQKQSQTFKPLHGASAASGRRVLPPGRRPRRTAGALKHEP